jgi:hypothetical protein
LRHYTSHVTGVFITTLGKIDATVTGVFTTLASYSPAFVNGVISFPVVPSYGFFTTHATLKLVGFS